MKTNQLFEASEKRSFWLELEYGIGHTRVTYSYLLLGEEHVMHLYCTSLPFVAAIIAKKNIYAAK